MHATVTSNPLKILHMTYRWQVLGQHTSYKDNSIASGPRKLGRQARLINPLLVHHFAEQRKTVHSQIRRTWNVSVLRVAS